MLTISILQKLNTKYGDSDTHKNEVSANKSVEISDSMSVVIADGADKTRLVSDGVASSVDLFYHQAQKLNWKEVTLTTDLYDLYIK